MATLHVYWRTADFDPDEQARRRRQVALTGILTDEHDEATPEQPVVVEERSERVYCPGELPPDTTVYFEDHPGPAPLLVEQARRAGYHIEHAEADPGMVDQPREARTSEDAEERAEPRTERL